MITRIVKMKIAEENVENYKTFINQVRSQIRNFEGCSHLDILNDFHDSTIFFSYSYWNNEESLNAYRDSEFFKTIWATLKQWFSEKAQAWSVIEI